MKFQRAFGLVTMLVAIDQYTKYLVETHLPLREVVGFIPFISLFRTYNEGIAFSFMAGWNSNILLGIIIAIVLFVTLMWLKLDRERHFAHLGFAFIVGGAIGNLIDRIWHGHVIDFVMFHTQNWSFAIFNLADAFITIGAGLIILDEVIHMRQTRQVQESGDQ